MRCRTNLLKKWKERLPFTTFLPIFAYSYATKAGLGIHSLVSWENRSFFAKKRANERFVQKNERFAQKTSNSPIRSFFVSNLSNSAFAHGCSFLVSDLSKSLTSLIKKREWANRSGFFKCTKKYDKNRILVKFSEQIAHSLICHERPEQIAQGRSFVMSDLSDLLTVPVLTWSTWVNRSQSLICPEWSERIAHSRSFDSSDLSKWANAQWANSQPRKLQYIVT